MWSFCTFSARNAARYGLIRIKYGSCIVLSFINYSHLRCVCFCIAPSFIRCDLLPEHIYSYRLLHLHCRYTASPFVAQTSNCVGCMVNQLHHGVWEQLIANVMNKRSNTIIIWSTRTTFSHVTISVPHSSIKPFIALNCNRNPGRREFCADW